jgi:ABC-type transporter Mla subunit MlaD
MTWQEAYIVLVLVVVVVLWMIYSQRNGDDPPGPEVGGPT